jgi:hypothetical protein
MSLKLCGVLLHYSRGFGSVSFIQVVFIIHSEQNKVMNFLETKCFVLNCSHLGIGLLVGLLYLYRYSLLLFLMPIILIRTKLDRI